MKMNQAGFALQIVNMPSGGFGQGSTMNSLRSAWTEASAWPPTFRSGRSQLSEAEKGNLLYNGGILMEDRNEDAKASKFQNIQLLSTDFA